MSRTVHFSYRFHPVGQGLFASGYLMKSGETKPDFVWVYDCGTSSSSTLVTNGIQKLKAESGDRDRIDLLVLSHFDHDHISGVCSLVKEFKIGTLMLPYMPLAQRMIVAFEDGSVAGNDVHAAFYVNPVSFLLTQDGPGIERILFVLPSGGEGPPLQDGSPDQPDDDGQPPELRFKQGKPEDLDEVLMLVEPVRSRQEQVEFLPPRSAIKLRSYWEFVPYNDDPETEITPEFSATVQALRKQLLLAVDPLARNAALKQLKNSYDEHFGNDSEERNLISLHLYAGPIYPSWSRTWLHSARWTHRQWKQFVKRGRNPSPTPNLEYGEWSCSILYTGDGYLDEPARLRRLVTYLHERRVQSTGVFQVMHHGSEANWHPGVAAAVAPLFSIFSSDPNRKSWKHPHAAVVRDFYDYTPVQVDKQKSFQAWGVLNSSYTDTEEPDKGLESVPACPVCWSLMVRQRLMVAPFTENARPLVLEVVCCGECNWETVSII